MLIIIKMKKIIIFLFAFLLINSTFAVIAFPEKVLFTQPNGEKVTVQMKGDEYVKYAQSEDGYTLLYDQDGYFNYAITNSDGNLIPSQFHASEISLRTREEQQFLLTVPKQLFFSELQLNSMIFIRNNVEQRLSQNPIPDSRGTMKLLCILMEFPDKPFVKTNQDFQNLFNQVGYNYSGASGSVHDFYAEASYNTLNLIFDVVGPFQTSENMDYYGSNSFGDASQMAYEAIDLVQSVVDFSDYDNDNDGTVDGLYIIFAGNGEEAGAGVDAIWSHAGGVSSFYDGVQIDRYACSPEHRGASGNSITYIGVICHELGHVLGAPDYYDTNYESGGSYEGTGNWDLMASGSWNNSGRTPAHPNPRIKVYTYQWASVTILSVAQTVILPTSLFYQNSFYRINTNTNNEYFIIENRVAQNFDIGNPGFGMMIYRCASNINSGSINTTHKQKFYPVAANSTQSLPTANVYGSINALSCPWPGSLNKTTFTDATSPSMKSWANANTNKPITNITLNPLNDIISFDFMGGGSLDSHRVFIPQRIGVTIIPESTSINPVPNNGSYSFSVTLANTHSNSNLIVRVGNDTLVPVIGVYTILNITTPKVVELLNVELNKYLIVATAGLNGTISPSDSSYVYHSNNATFTFTPTVGFGVSNVIVDGDSLGILTSYTFTNVVDNHTIEVEFGVGSPDIIQTAQNNLQFVTNQHVPSVAQTSLISADVSQLTINVLVKAPTHFQVSINGSSWVSQLVMQKSNLPQDLYVRFNPSIIGIISDTIKIASSGALTYLFVSGESTVGVNDDQFIDDVKIFPNPATISTNINIPEPLLRNQKWECSIYDPIGKIITTFEINSVDTEIYTQQWKSGLYSVILISNGQIVAKKLLIQN